MADKTIVQAVIDRLTGKTAYVTETLKDIGGGELAQQVAVVNPDGTTVGSPQATAIGTTADPAATDSTSAWSVVALLKGIYAKLAGTLTTTLAAGTNVIGKVGIDQTTPGTTNRVDIGTAAAITSVLPSALSSAGGLKTDPVTALAGEDFTNDRLRTEVKPADADSLLETLQNAVTATGNGTAINMKGYKGVTLDITGTFVGTVTFEATIDDSNWFAIGLIKVSDGTYATTATAVGTFSRSSNHGEWSQFRARISAYTSGSITAKSRKYAR